MDCIPYIQDLKLEIDTLKTIKSSGNSNKEIDELISSKEKALEKCKDNLSKLKNGSIEYRLYINILNGMSPTKAVEAVADENYINDTKPSTYDPIWRRYRKLKELLKQ